MSELSHKYLLHTIGYRCVLGILPTHDKQSGLQTKIIMNHCLGTLNTYSSKEGGRP